MKLSIVIPNYNSEKTIKKTLDSVISQNFQFYELIVVDDKSTDNSIALIKKTYPKAKIYKNETNRGAGFTRNVGIKHASGDLILFIDSDVYIKNGLIESLIEFSKYDIVFPKITYENGLSMYPNTKQDEEYLLISPIFLMSKSGIKKLKGSLFDENYSGYCEDTDFFLKCKLLGLTSKFVSDAMAVHVVNKPKNREDRYYSEVVSTIYGGIKYFGFKDINQLDHAFKISNIAKLYLLGIFNFKLFDAQINNFNKDGSAYYKAIYMLKNKNKITDKGSLYLFLITIKGIYFGISKYSDAMRGKERLKKLISGGI